MRSHWIVVTVACLMLACARGAHAQVPADPYVQVTPSQVSNALGETVGAGRKSGTATCTWVADKPAHRIVTLMYAPPGNWDSRKTRQTPGITKSSVSGVGDDAIAETLGPLTTLFVKKGEYDVHGARVRRPCCGEAARDRDADRSGRRWEVVTSG
jgi:hypothetical protein